MAVLVQHKYVVGQIGRVGTLAEAQRAGDAAGASLDVQDVWSTPADLIQAVCNRAVSSPPVHWTWRQDAKGPTNSSAAEFDARTPGPPRIAPIPSKTIAITIPPPLPL